MKSNNLIIFAPGHDEKDHRVIRSLKVCNDNFTKVVLFLECDRVSSSFNNTSNILKYNKKSIYNIFFLKKDLFADDIFKIKDFNFIYIHDSGLYGLLLVRYFNYFYKDIKVIFDYHDFLPWEMYHHVNKFVSKLFKFKNLSLYIYKFINFFFLKYIFNNLQIVGLIGISSGQCKRLLKDLNLQVSYLALPNTRPFCLYNAKYNNDVLTRILWVGNVGINRGFESVCNLVEDLSESKNIDPNLYVVGKVWGEINSFNFNHIDSYCSDLDIINLINDYNYIGIFPGWADPYNFGINEIGSPNKVFSYINIGIPFLIPSNLSDFIIENNIPPMFIYNDIYDIKSKIILISNNYHFYKLIVQNLKREISWDEFYKDELNLFIKKYL